MLGHPLKKNWLCKEARDILLAAVVLESGITEAAQQKKGDPCIVGGRWSPTSFGPESSFCI